MNKFSVYTFVMHVALLSHISYSEPDGRPTSNETSLITPQNIALGLAAVATASTVGYHCYSRYHSKPQNSPKKTATDLKFPEKDASSLKPCIKEPGTKKTTKTFLQRIIDSIYGLFFTKITFVDTPNIIPEPTTYVVVSSPDLVRAIQSLPWDKWSKRKETQKLSPTDTFSAEGGSIRYLLNRGANVNAANKNGVTPLRAAISQLSYELAEELIRRGARTDDPNDDPLDFAIQKLLYYDYKILRNYSVTTLRPECIRILFALLKENRSMNKDDSQNLFTSLESQVEAIIRQEHFSYGQYETKMPQETNEQDANYMNRIKNAIEDETGRKIHALVKGMREVERSNATADHPAQQ